MPAPLSRDARVIDLEAVRTHTLGNGLRLRVLPERSSPTVCYTTLFQVGSRNERPGITGISHLFEHMMFKGTMTIGSKDPKRDLEIMAEQEKLRDEMRAEESKMRAAWRRGEVDDLAKPENRTARYKELEAKFDALVKEQRELLVKNEFDRVYTKNGASGMNAFTSNDMTVYFITVPKNKLDDGGGISATSHEAAGCEQHGHGEFAGFHNRSNSLIYDD